MKLYEKPEIETLKFDTVDIITTSEETADIDGGSQDVPNTWLKTVDENNPSIRMGW